MLLDWATHPVDLGIPGDGGVVHIHHDDLEVLVGRILSNPVRVQNSQTLESPANTFLSDGLKIPLWLLLLHSTRSLGLAIRTALSNGALAAVHTWSTCGSLVGTFQQEPQDP